MKRIYPLAPMAVLVALVALASGCLLAGNYHSAKTLAKGESSFGLTFTATTYEFTDSNGDTARISLPVVFPEITFHVGLEDNLEVGGRVGLFQLGIEGDLKYRILRSERLHVAIAPSISGQSLILVSGTTLKLPAIATYDLSDNVAVTGSVFGTTSRYSSINTGDSDDDGFGRFSGTLGATGGSFALELSGATFAIRPGIEFTRYVVSFGDDQSFDGFSTVSFMVHLSFIRGREKQQLDRIERKLDNALGVPPQ